MIDTASDEFTRADPLYQRARALGSNCGQAFHVEAPHRSGWPLVLVGLLAVIVGLGLLGMGR